MQSLLYSWKPLNLIFALNFFPVLPHMFSVFLCFFCHAIDTFLEVFTGCGS